MISPIWGGAALLGILATLWSRIKLIAWRVVNLLIVRARLESGIGSAVLSYCWKDMKRSPFGEKRFGSVVHYVLPEDRLQDVGYEDISTDPMVFWNGWRPLIVSYSQGEGKLGENMGGAVTISYIRGTYNLDDFLIHCLDKRNDERHGILSSYVRFRVEKVFGSGPVRLSRSSSKDYNGPDLVSSRADDKKQDGVRFLKWSLEDLVPKKFQNTFQRLAFPPEIMDVVDRCRRWYSSKEWYEEKEIPWRLGVLCYGQPGTGKTSLVRAIAQELDLPVFSFDLASFSNRDFEGEWANLQSRTPCIALLEDIDAIFAGRENRLGEEGGGLTFDCFLNAIGGINEASGVLVFVTTNRVEFLDEALGKPDEGRGMSTRPGRIDIAVELGPLDEICRRRIAERILIDWPDKIDELIKEGEGDTGCQFQERCTRLALDLYWQDYQSRDTQSNVSRNPSSKNPSKNGQIHAGTPTS